MIAGFMMNNSFIYKTIEKKYPDGTVWVIFVEGDGYVQVSLYAKSSGGITSRNYVFKNHRYLIHQVPKILKRAGWLSTALSTLDSIAAKYD